MTWRLISSEKYNGSFSLSDIDSFAALTFITLHQPKLLQVREAPSAWASNCMSIKLHEHQVHEHQVYQHLVYQHQVYQHQVHRITSIKSVVINPFVHLLVSEPLNSLLNILVTVKFEVNFLHCQIQIQNQYSSIFCARSTYPCTEVGRSVIHVSHLPNTSLYLKGQDATNNWTSTN